MLNTKTTSVPMLSRHPLAPLNIADTYSLSSINDDPFETKTNKNATANQFQTLYQPYSAPNLSLSTVLPYHLPL